MSQSRVGLNISCWDLGLGYVWCGMVWFGEGGRAKEVEKVGGRERGSLILLALKDRSFRSFVRLSELPCDSSLLTNDKSKKSEMKLLS